MPDRTSASTRTSRASCCCSPSPSTPARTAPTSNACSSPVDSSSRPEACPTDTRPATGVSPNRVRCRTAASAPAAGRRLRFLPSGANGPHALATIQTCNIGVEPAFCDPGGHKPSPPAKPPTTFCSGSLGLSTRQRLLCTCHCVSGPPTSGASVKRAPNGSMYIADTSVFTPLRIWYTSDSGYLESRMWLSLTYAHFTKCSVPVIPSLIERNPSA